MNEVIQSTLAESSRINTQAAQAASVKQIKGLPEYLNIPFNTAKRKVLALTSEWPNGNNKINRAIDVVVATTIANAITIGPVGGSSDAFWAQNARPQVTAFLGAFNEHRLINIDNCLMIAEQVWHSRAHIANYGFNTKMTLEVLEDNPALPKSVTELLDDDSCEDVLKGVLNNG